MVKKFGLFRLFNNRGEAGADDKAGAGAGDKGGEAKFSQADLDRVVQERLSREKSKYSDYEDLRKFRDEHSKEQEKLKQDELIRQKKYDEAEQTYKTQLTEREKLLAEKDARIQDMTISGALSQEISRQNGFVEETIALLKNSAMITKEGAVVLKLRDTNGIEKEVGVEEGLKQFYAQRPHLLKVKSSAGGSGTPPAGQSGGAGAEDLTSLNSQLMTAMAKGDTKTIGEIREKIKAHPMRGNSRAF